MRLIGVFSKMAFQSFENKGDGEVHLSFRSLPSLLALIFFLMGCSTELFSSQHRPSSTPDARELSSTSSPSGSNQIDVFLKNHWTRPLASQGIAQGLSPQSCGQCHASQHADWKKSWHAHSMGNGMMGQLIELKPQDLSAQRSCLRCHAPLAEQEKALVDILKKKLQPQSQAHVDGLICAGCHMRSGVWFGPPRRNAPALQPEQMKVMPHGGWKVSEAFEDSRFCAACHQFQTGEYALNGKFLENTYEEWRQSPYPAQGKTCQVCHMPERRHLWRGIHDKEMTFKAVSVDVVSPQVVDNKISAEMKVTNVGAGHDFPTYVTPKVVLEIFQIDHRGRQIRGTKVESIISREVSLDLRREIADTRLAPGKSQNLTYFMPKNRLGRALVFQIKVEPDSFYEKFYSSVLREKRSSMSRKALTAALKTTRQSPYTLYYSKQELHN
jgi:Cytochrome c554 and c-prime